MDEAMETMNADVDLGDMEEQAEQLILNIEKQAQGANKNL